MNEHARYMHPVARRPSRSRRNPARTALSLVVLVLAAVGLSAAPAAAAAEPEGAWVRAAHLVPGLGTMSIGLSPFSGSTGGAAAPSAGAVAAPAAAGMLAIAPAASYGQVTDYAQIPAGYYTISVRPAGAPAASAPIITGTLKAQAGQAFTVAGLGTKASPRVTALSDDLTPPPSGRSRVRLLPAAQQAPTITVTARNGPTVAKDATFGQATGYATVPAGGWSLKADAGAAGTATGDISLSAGSVYTLLVLDGDKGLRIKPVLDASGMGVMPQGGAATGGGGLAGAGSGSPSATAVAVGSLLTMSMLLAAAGLVPTAARRARRRH